MLLSTDICLYYRGTLSIKKVLFTLKMASSNTKLKLQKINLFAENIYEIIDYYFHLAIFTNKLLLAVIVISILITF